MEFHIFLDILLHIDVRCVKKMILIISGHLKDKNGDKLVERK